MPHKIVAACFLVVWLLAIGSPISGSEEGVNSPAGQSLIASSIIGVADLLGLPRQTADTPSASLTAQPGTYIFSSARLPRRAQTSVANAINSFCKLYIREHALRI